MLREELKDVKREKERLERTAVRIREEARIKERGLEN